MIAEPLSLQDRPQPQSSVAARPVSAASAADSRPRPAEAAPILSMAGVTSSLQLLLAARRAARFSGKSTARD